MITCHHASYCCWNPRRHCCGNFRHCCGNHHRMILRQTCRIPLMKTWRVMSNFSLMTLRAKNNSSLMIASVMSRSCCQMTLKVN